MEWAQAFLFHCPSHSSLPSFPSLPSLQSLPSLWLDVLVLLRYWQPKHIDDGFFCFVLFCYGCCFVSFWTLLFIFFVFFFLFISFSLFFALVIKSIVIWNIYNSFTENLLVYIACLFQSMCVISWRGKIWFLLRLWFD